MDVEQWWTLEGNHQSAACAPGRKQATLTHQANSDWGLLHAHRQKLAHDRANALSKRSSRVNTYCGGRRELNINSAKDTKLIQISQCFLCKLQNLL